VDLPIFEKLKLAFFWFMRGPFWLLFGLFLGFGLPYFWHLDRLVRDRFAELKFAVPSRVFARPLSFSIGQSLTKPSLLAELAASRYRELELAAEPGSYQVSGSRFVIVTRPFTDLNGLQPSLSIRVDLANGKIAKLQNAYSGTKLDGVKLDPARIATLYGGENFDCG
jgi:penicillin-binding protein 1B